MVAAAGAIGLSPSWGQGGNCIWLHVNKAIATYLLSGTYDGNHASVVGVFCPKTYV
jgi:hypothetical protein